MPSRRLRSSSAPDLPTPPALRWVMLGSIVVFLSTLATPGIAAPESSATAVDTAVVDTAAIDTGDWPEIRGPRRDGISQEPGLLRGWPAEGPPELWRRSLGDGFSGVSAWGDRLVTMDAQDRQEGVVCLDATSGATLWRTSLTPTFEDSFGNGPRSTPVIAPGDKGFTVTVVTSDMRLAVLSLADGAIHWSRSLSEDFGTPMPRFGYGSSPLQVGDLLVVDVGGVDEDHPAPAVIAFDTDDGTVRWQALEGRTGYAAPMLASFGGVKQIVMARNAGPEVVSLALDGSELWSHPGPPGVIAMPVVVPPNRLFVSSADDDYGGHLLEIARGETGFEVTEVWDNRRMRNHIGTSLRVGDHLYGFDNATFQCLDAATGERRWAVRGFGKGTLVAGGDLLYVLGDDGTLALVEANPAAYTELGRLQVMTGKAWTAPTLAHGRLILRDHDELVAFDVRERAETVASPHPTTVARHGTTAPPTPVAEGPDAGVNPPRLEAILARYAAARGGIERWRRLKGMAFEGTYATFSNIARFEEVRLRTTPGGGHFRLELDMLGMATIRAHDAEGPWMLFPVVDVFEPTRIDPAGDYGPYHGMVEREALFEPPLLDPAAHGATVELLGPDAIAERPTIALRLTYAKGEDENEDGAIEEIWHLDPETYLEVAVVDTVHDFSLAEEPMERRTFTSDFRDFDGVVIPLHRELEFGSRLEVVTIETVTLDPEVDPDAVSLARATEGAATEGSATEGSAADQDPKPMPR